MCKNVRVLISSSGIFQKKYLEGKTKKLEDNNANAAQTKTEPAPSKKYGQKQPKFMTKKHSNKMFTKIILLSPKLKTLWSTCKNCNNVSNIPEV